METFHISLSSGIQFHSHSDFRNSREGLRGEPRIHAHSELMVSRTKVTSKPLFQIIMAGRLSRSTADSAILSQFLTLGLSLKFPPASARRRLFQSLFDGFSIFNAVDQFHFALCAVFVQKLCARLWGLCCARNLEILCCDLEINRAPTPRVRTISIEERHLSSRRGKDTLK
jgi:hypothetical protein